MTFDKSQVNGINKNCKFLGLTWDIHTDYFVFILTNLAESLKNVR